MLFYKEKLDTETSNIKKVGWDNEEKAVDRYKFIAGLIPEHTTSLVDYGCGLGNFSKYITPNILYTGVDVYNGFVEEANRLHPNLAIFQSEGNGLVPVCDCIVNIGVWTLRNDIINDTDDMYWSNIKFQLSNLVKCFTNCMIINGFHNFVGYCDSKLYYHDLDVWLKYAEEMNLDIDIHKFAQYEFVIVLKKKY